MASPHHWRLSAVDASRERDEECLILIYPQQREGGVVVEERARAHRPGEAFWEGFQWAAALAGMEDHYSRFVPRSRHSCFGLRELLDSFMPSRQVDIVDQSQPACSFAASSYNIIHTAREIIFHLTAFWAHFKQLNIKSCPPISAILHPIKWHFLVWCLSAAQGDGEGLNVERNSSLNIYANGKTCCHKVWSCLTHTHIHTHKLL